MLDLPIAFQKNIHKIKGLALPGKQTVIKGGIVTIPGIEIFGPPDLNILKQNQKPPVGSFYDFRPLGPLDYGFQRKVAEIFQQKKAEAGIRGINSGRGKPLFLQVAADIKKGIVFRGRSFPALGVRDGDKGFAPGE